MPARSSAHVAGMSGLLSPFIALLINKSLTTGCFPGEFKEAKRVTIMPKDIQLARRIRA